MKPAFHPVLQLEIWHDYHLGQSDGLETLPARYDISDTISLVPTMECQKSLRNLRWIFRNQPYGAILLANTQNSAGDDEVTPFVPIDTNARLTFWMVIRDRNFHNYTNLSLTKPRDRIYYFSNRINNQPSEGAPLSLTQPLMSYRTEDEYQFGHLVTYEDTQGDFTLEASKYQPAVADGNDAPNLDETVGEWISLPSSQYVSNQDCVLSQGLSRTQVLPPADVGHRWQISLRDINDKETFALTVEVPEDLSADGQLPVNLNFSGQQPGYYQLQINGEVVDTFVIFDPLTARNAFALVELSLNPTTLSPSFQLLTRQADNLRLQTKTYQIRFKNRSTFWRYRHSRPPWIFRR